MTLELNITSVPTTQADDTPIANMVGEMIARGVPAEVIILAIRTAERAGRSTGIPQNSADVSAERRRARDRERKRLSAEFRRNSAEIPQNSNSPLILTSLDSKKEEKKESISKTRSTKFRGIPLPADWHPNPKHLEAATKLGFTEKAVLDKAEDMRIWAGSGGKLKVDWDLTFHGFLRRDAAQRPPPVKPQPGWYRP